MKILIAIVSCQAFKDNGNNCKHMIHGLKICMV